MDAGKRKARDFRLSQTLAYPVVQKGSSAAVASKETRYCSLAYSTLASFRMGMSGSASVLEILNHPHVAIEVLSKKG